MTIHLYLPESYKHDHFLLVVEKRATDISNEDQAALTNILRRSRRTAKRLAKLDAQN